VNAIILESVCTADPSHHRRMKVSAPTEAGLSGLAYVVPLINCSQPSTPCAVCGAPMGRYRVLEPEEGRSPANGAAVGK
jgi:hypothetical protein